MIIIKAACSPFIKWKIAHATKRRKFNQQNFERFMGGQMEKHEYTLDFSFDMGILSVSKLCNTYNSIGCDAVACNAKV